MQMLKDVKVEMGSHIIIEDFSKLLSVMNRSLDRKKEILDFNTTLHIFRTFHPTVAGYTCFSIAYGTLSRIDHMLCICSVAPSRPVFETPWTIVCQAMGWVVYGLS